MNNVTDQIAGILALVVGVAIVSVLVSRNSQTSSVIQAAASGFGNILSVATAPVTGQGGQVNLTYPTSNAAALGSFSGLTPLNINGLV